MVRMLLRSLWGLLPLSSPRLWWWWLALCLRRASLWA